MNPTSELSHQIEGRVLTLTRTFDAPRDLVFEVFTNCEHLQHWWGPQGWSLPVCQMDFRPGGRWFYCMAGPEGEPSCGVMEYHEIEAPERIVATDRFADSEGKPNEEMPAMRNTYVFSEEDGKTVLFDRAEFVSEAELRTVVEMGMLEGIGETFERLDAYLAQAQAR